MDPKSTLSFVNFKQIPYDLFFFAADYKLLHGYESNIPKNDLIVWRERSRFGWLASWHSPARQLPLRWTEMLTDSFLLLDQNKALCAQMQHAASITRTPFNQPTLHRHNSFWFIPLKHNLVGKCIVTSWCDVGECVLQDESEGVAGCVGNPCSTTAWKTGELFDSDDRLATLPDHPSPHTPAFILKPHHESRLRCSYPQTPKNTPNHHVKRLQWECENQSERRKESTQKSAFFFATLNKRNEKIYKLHKNVNTSVLHFFSMNPNIFIYN